VRVKFLLKLLLKLALEDMLVNGHNDGDDDVNLVLVGVAAVLLLEVFNRP